MSEARERIEHCDLEEVLDELSPPDLEPALRAAMEEQDRAAKEGAVSAWTWRRGFVAAQVLIFLASPGRSSPSAGQTRARKLPLASSFWRPRTGR